MTQVTDREPGFRNAESLNVEVPATLVTLLQLNVDDISFLGIAVKSETSAVFQDAFDQFEVQGRFHRDDEFHTLYATGFDTPTGLVVGASGDLTLLAYQATGWLLLNVLPLYEVRIQAASDAAGDGTGEGLLVSTRAHGKA
jgi:hypothetical protein